MSDTTYKKVSTRDSEYLRIIVFSLSKSTFPLRKKSPYLQLFWSASFQHFPTFGLNTERYYVSLRIQSKCGKIEKNADQNNSEYGHFLRSAALLQYLFEKEGEEREEFSPALFLKNEKKYLNSGKKMI